MFKIKEGLQLFNKQTTVRYPSGNYGSFEIDGGAKGGYEGYSIGGRVTFMHDNGTATGLYDDVNNKWMLLAYLNGETRLYHSGTQKLATKSGGVTVNGTLTADSLVGSINYNQISNPPSIPDGNLYVRKSGDTMTGALTMSGFTPINLGDGNHYLKKISTGYSGVTIDGPQLQGHQGGELTTNYQGDKWALRWNTSQDVYIGRYAYVNNGSRVFADNYHPNADKWTTARSHVVNLTGDVTGSASQSVDGTGNRTWNISTTVVNNSHSHTPESIGAAKFVNDAYLNSSTTTATFITELTNEFGCFNNSQVTLKCAWSYSGNSNLNTGHPTIGTIELAGCTIETWGGTYKHVRITRPNTGTGGHGVYEYNDQSSGYAPGWREIWTSESDGSGSGLDADLLDGQHGSYYAPASHNHSLTLSGDVTGSGSVSGTISVSVNNDSHSHSNYVTTNTAQIVTGTKDFISTANHYSGHFYYDAFDANGMHYPHFLDGSGSTGVRVNWRIYNGSSLRLNTWDYNYNDFHTNVRAPIFYDSNNTAYYADPASTSNFSVLNANTLNITTLNATNLSVSGNTTLGNGNGDTTRVNDILYVQATDSGDAHMHFGENSSNGYGAYWHWDSGYRMTLNSRNAGTNTPVYYFDTNSTSYLNMGRAIHMQNKNIDYVNQLHFNSNVRFYDESNDSYLNFKWGDTGSGGIKFYDGNTTLHGYIYGDGNGRFGLLDNDGSWAVRIQTGTSPLELRCNNNVEFEVYDSYTNSPGSSRAPIFYDSDNTGYFLNPASGSNLNQIRTAGHISVGNHGDSSASTVSTSAVITFGSLSTDAINNYSIQTRKENYGGNYNKLDLSFHTGIRLGAHPNYGGVRFFSDQTMGTEIASIGKSGNFIVGNNSVRSPIFYDNNDTSYYVDPNSDSKLRSINGYPAWSGSITVGGDANTYYPVTWWGGDQDQITEIEIYRAYHSTAPSTWNTSSHKGGLSLRFSTNFGGWGGSNYDEKTYDFRETYSSIVSDISRFGSQRGICVWLRGGGAVYQVRVRGRDYGPTVTLGSYDPGGNNTGVTSRTDAPKTWLQRTNFLRGGRLYSYDQLVLDHGSGHQTKSGILQSDSSLRAPIFYDSNDTTYYYNPNSDSVQYGRIKIRTNRDFSGYEATSNASGRAQSILTSYYSDVIIASQQSNVNHGSTLSFTAVNPSNTGDYRKFVVNQGNWGGSHLLRFGWRDGIYGNPHEYVGGSFGGSYDVLGLNGSSKIVYAFGQLHTPIMYDYNNTGYYIHADSNSNLNTLSMNGSLTFNNYGVGVTGRYSATRFQQVFGMDNQYSLASDGVSPSNMYGIAWTHSNNTNTNGRKISGHHACFMSAGTTRAAIGDHIWTSGNITAYSDRRVKTNIEHIPDALDKVCKLNGYTFDRTDFDLDIATGEMPNTRQTGVIAQEVLEVLPEAVTGSEEEHYSVAYGNMVGLLIEAIKEQQIQIEELSSQLNSLKEK